MKQLEVQLQKRILIVDGEFLFYHNGRPLKFICKGPDFNEGIAKGLVEIKKVFDTPEVYFFKNYKKEFSDCLTALPSFISAIESKGYYWGENPVKHPENMEIIPASLGWWLKQAKKHDEAESRTFNLEKTLIFEIL
nr:MAG TPA: hypothetical protein [Caudoviricetes sp.]